MNVPLKFKRKLSTGTIKKNVLYFLICFGVMIIGTLCLRVTDLASKSHTLTTQHSTHKTTKEKISTPLALSEATTSYYCLDIYGMYGQKLVSAIPDQTVTMFLEDTLDFTGKCLTDGSKYTEDQPESESLSNIYSTKKGWSICTERYSEAKSNNSQNKLTHFYVMSDRLFVANNSGKDSIILNLGINPQKVVTGDILLRYATSTPISLLYPRGPILGDSLTREKKCSNTEPYNFDTVHFKIGDSLYIFDTITGTFTKK